MCTAENAFVAVHTADERGGYEPILAVIAASPESDRREWEANRSSPPPAGPRHHSLGRREPDRKER